MPRSAACLGIKIVLACMLCRACTEVNEHAFYACTEGIE